jgi:signal transduction histidine kinase
MRGFARSGPRVRFRAEELVAKKRSGPRARRVAVGRQAEPAGESARIRSRFERLLTAAVAIFSERSLERVLQTVADSARDVVGARYAALGVLGPDRDSLVQFVTSGMSQAQRDRIGDLPQGRGLLGVVIQEGRPIRTADINRHPQRYGFPPNHPPMKSFLGVPITARGQVFGNLYLTEKLDAAEFSAEDEAIAVLFAAQVAVAVENARLYDESQRLLAQVQGMQRQRDLFHAMMNHELRNAVTGVYGWAERLIRTKAPENMTRAAAEVFEGAERTITLINNFLDITGLDSGRVRPVWREVEVRGAIERALAGLKPAAEAKRISLSAHVAGSLESVRTDPLRLQQILVNLLSNAIRHTPEGGAVAVHAAAAGAEVCFRVTDTGPGVPAEIRDRIFEPFLRFDEQSGHGTGLGLPVSRRLAELLGGTLAVEEGAGRGAAFVLVLPIAPSGT